jgi:hypothetical protein
MLSDLISKYAGRMPGNPDLNPSQEEDQIHNLILGLNTSNTGQLQDFVCGAIYAQVKDKRIMVKQNSFLNSDCVKTHVFIFSIKSKLLNQPSITIWEKHLQKFK